MNVRSEDARPEPSDDAAPRPRPWYRLHRSTWIGTLVFAGFLTILIVPGETQSGGSGGSGASFYVTLHLQHGWPWTYFDHWHDFPPGVRFEDIPPFTAFPHRPDWTTRWAWTFSQVDDIFRPAALLWDCLVAIGLLLIAAAALELRRRRRRITQWTLRELLALTVIVACFFAYWRMADARQAQEKRDWEELRQLAKEHALPVPGAWSGNYVGPLWLRRLFGPLPGFEANGAYHFGKRGSPLTAADIEPLVPALAKFRHLNSIWIDCDTDVDKSAYQCIASMPQISRLSIACHSGKDSMQISSQGLRYLVEMKNLRSLEFNHVAEVCDSALLHKLTSLEELSIIAPKIDDPRLSFLAGMKKLRRLELLNVPCDDRAVANIVQLQELEWIDVDSPLMSPESLDQLRAALPNCNTGLLALRRKTAVRRQSWAAFARAIGDNSTNVVSPKCRICWSSGFSRDMPPKGGTPARTISTNLCETLH